MDIYAFNGHIVIDKVQIPHSKPNPILDQDTITQTLEAYSKQW